MANSDVLFNVDEVGDSFFQNAAHNTSHCEDSVNLNLMRDENRRSLFEFDFEDEYGNENDPLPPNVDQVDDGSELVIESEEGGSSSNINQVAIKQPKRARQYVATLSEVQTCVKWMKNEYEAHGRKRLMAKTIQQFPQTFNTNTKADLRRTSRYWDRRDEILAALEAPKEVTCVQDGNQKRTSPKASASRGRKRQEWVSWLHTELKFERLLNIGVKFSASTVQTLALNILNNPDSLFKGDYVPSDELTKPIAERMTYRWIQAWRERYGIILRSPSRKPNVSEVKRTGDLEEDAIQNIGETHIVINQSRAKIYGFKCQQVKLMDVVDETESLTLVLRVSGGRDAQSHAPFVIFSNNDSSYPIHGLPEVIDRVSYRTSPKGWMSRAVFEEYLAEDRAISRHPNGKTIQLFLDDCTGHMETSAATEVLRLKNI